MKKILAGSLALLLLLTLLMGCGTQPQPEPTENPVEQEQEVQEQEPVGPEPVAMNIGSLKGPTSIGLVKLMEASETGSSANPYTFTVAGTPDELVAKLAKGELDAAAIPANLAAVLHKNTGGKISVAAINTLGVLYLVENGEQIGSVTDLKGKTLYTTGRGTTPEYVLNYVLAANGLDPQQDVTIEFKSEATEVAALLAGQSDVIAMLPQPFVTTAQMNNDKLRISLDMTAEWEKVQGPEGSALVTGVVVVNNSFLEAHEAAFQVFMEEYQASTQYVNEQVDAAAALVGKYEIVPEPVAKRAIPYCNITFIQGKELEQKLSGYLEVLFEQNPASVGGVLPDESFYYQK